MIMLLATIELENPPGVGLSVSLINDEYKIAISKLTDYFTKSVNRLQMLYDFGQIKQWPNEKMKEFEVRIRDAAKKCNFVDFEERIVEKIMLGTSDSKLVKMILTNRLQTLREIVEQGVANEMLEEKPENKRQCEAVSVVKSSSSFKRARVDDAQRRPSKKQNKKNQPREKKKLK